MKLKWIGNEKYYGEGFYAENGYSYFFIERSPQFGFSLKRTGSFIGNFKKLKDAKLVAQLIANG